MARLLANVLVDGERLSVGDELPSWAVGKVPAALLAGGVSPAAQKPPEDAFGGVDEDVEPEPERVLSEKQTKALNRIKDSRDD